MILLTSIHFLNKSDGTGTDLARSRDAIAFKNQNPIQLTESRFFPCCMQMQWWVSKVRYEIICPSDLWLVRAVLAPLDDSWLRARVRAAKISPSVSLSPKPGVATITGLSYAGSLAGQTFSISRSQRHRVPLFVIDKPESKSKVPSPSPKGKRNLDSGLSLKSYGPPPLCPTLAGLGLENKKRGIWTMGCL